MFNGKVLPLEPGASYKIQIQCGFKNASYQLYSDLQGQAVLNLNARLTSSYDTWNSGEQQGFQLTTVASVNQWDNWVGGGMAAPGSIASQSTVYGLVFLGSTYLFTDPAFLPSANHYLQLEGFQVWMTSDGYWETVIQAANWYKGDGTLIQNISGPLSLTSDAPVPMASMIPLFNGQLVFNGFVGNGPDGLFVSNNFDRARNASGAHTYVNALGTASAGWRASIDNGATWITPPVRMLDSNIGSTGTSWEPNFNFGFESYYGIRDLGASSHYTFGSLPARVMGTVSYETRYGGMIHLMPCGPFAAPRLLQDSESPIAVGPYGQFSYTYFDSSGDPPPPGAVVDPETGNWHLTTVLLPGIAQTFEMALDAPAAGEHYAFLSTPLAPCPTEYTIEKSLHSDPGANLLFWAPDSSVSGTWYFHGYNPGYPYESYGISFTDPDYATYHTTDTGAMDENNEWAFLPQSGAPTGYQAYLTSPSGDYDLSYWNTACHPHWSMFFPFVYDLTDIPNLIAPMHLEGGKAGWEVYDAETSAWQVDYWKTIQQTYDLDVIPQAQRTQRRAHHVWPPFNSRGLGGMLDSNLGIGFHGSYWWGTTGAKWIIPGVSGTGQVLSVLLGASCSSRWSLPSALGASSSLTVTNTVLTFGPATTHQIQVFFDLASWDSYPYGWTRLANKITIPALPANSNVAKWSISMIGEDGATYEIANSLTSSLPGTFALGPGKNKKWSVSAEMAFGDGTVPDTYTSLLIGTDDSAAVYGNDPSLLASTEKVGACAATKLQLTLLPVDGSQGCVFGTPTLATVDASTMRLMTLNSRDSVVLVPNGPSVLIGPQVFWDPNSSSAGPDGLLLTPKVNATIENGQMSAGDVGMLYLQLFNPPPPGTDPYQNFANFMKRYFAWGTTGLLEWIETHHFWSDSATQSQLTTGFALGPVPAFAMVNSFSALPPLALGGGEQLRSSATGWQAQGGRVQAGYVGSTTRQYVVMPWQGSPSPQPQLIAPSNAPSGTTPGANCLVADTATCAGWSVQYFHGRISNDEGQGDYVLKL